MYDYLQLPQEWQGQHIIAFCLLCFMALQQRVIDGKY